MDEKTPIYLYKECVPDLLQAVESSEKQRCNGLITSITNPNFRREFVKEPMRQNHLRFTRSELLLEPSKWQTQVIAKLSDWIDCDSVDEDVRKFSESTIKQEIEFSQHVAGQGRIMLKLRGTHTVNLARTISAELTNNTLLVEVPMAEYEVPYSSNYDEGKTIDTWSWWNRFRSYVDYNSRIQLALELPADLPSQEINLRWLGEMVELLIIPTSLFTFNRSNYPVLPYAHKQFVLKCLQRTNCKFALKPSDDLSSSSLCNYVNLLRHLYQENNKLSDPMVGYASNVELLSIAIIDLPRSVLLRDKK